MSRLFALVVFVTSSYASVASGTQWRTPSAIETNLLAIDGLVVFIQGNGGLTVLDGQTGAVKLRRQLPPEVGYPNELLSSPAGLLVKSYGKLALFDTKKFEPLWIIDKCSDVRVDGDLLLLHDGNHTVRCHDAATGQEKWRQVIKGGWRLALAHGIAVVTVEPRYSEPSNFRAFDANTGRELIHAAPPANRQWLGVHIGDGALYAVTMPLVGDDYEDVPDGIVKYDLEGRELERLTILSPRVTTSAYGGYPLMVDDIILDHDRGCRQAFSFELADKQDAIISDGNFRFVLSTGIAKEDSIKDSASEPGHVIEYTSAGGGWMCYLPYMKGSEWIQDVCEADGRLFVCASGGQVECLDLATGKSQWLYAFPSFRRVLTETDTFIGTYRTSQQDRQRSLFRQGIRQLGEKSGSIVLPGGQVPPVWSRLIIPPYTAPIVIDPQPELLFADLPARIRSAGLYAGACLLGLLGLLVANRCWRRTRESQLNNHKWPTILALVVGAMLLIACLVGLVTYSRVSWSCTLLLSATLLLAWWHVGSLMRRLTGNRWSLVETLIMFAILGTVIGLMAPAV